MDVQAKLASIAYGGGGGGGGARGGGYDDYGYGNNSYRGGTGGGDPAPGPAPVRSSASNKPIHSKLASIAYGSGGGGGGREGYDEYDNGNYASGGGSGGGDDPGPDPAAAPSSSVSSKPTHSIKVPRLYKEAAKALKKVEEDGEGLKSVIHALKHPNVKALTALVSEALKHAPQLEVLITKSKILKKEVGLAKQTHLVKILLTELLWGKKRLGGESKPVLTVTSYKEKFDKILTKLDEETGDDGASSKEVFKKPRYARVNTLKMELADAISYLHEEGWNQVSWDDVYELGQYDFVVDNFVDNLLVFAPGTEFHNHPLYLNGSLVLQDKASCLAAMALKPRKGRNIVDACAAPGMKTSHLAAITQNECPITAVEKSSKRFETLKTIVDSLGATNVTAINQNFTDLNPADYPDVEYILVDPSCSGSGMYNRLEIQLQAKEKKNMDRILKLQYYQLKVLRHAMKFPNVKRIVYSTCSLDPEENEDVIAEALEWINTETSRDEVGLAGITWSFKLKRALPDWPHRVANDNYEWADMCVRADESDLTDGFFVAVLERVK